VDGEPSIRRALRTTLLALGFEIAEASTGEEALALLPGERYDVALLDVEIPGIERNRELRRMDPRLQIVSARL
jgi:two-component system KDP operon response regulator KdpE